MTTSRFLRLALRRWYFVLLGLGVTAVAVYLVVLRAPVVYWSHSTMTLLQPDPNPLRAEGSYMTGAASAMVIRVNGGVAQTKTASPETTLYGEGVLEGSRVRIRDVGRQWTTSIPDPIIDVEVIGRDPAEVDARMRELLARLEGELAEMQDDLGVGSTNLIISQIAPQPPAVVQIGAGSRIRALGASLALGAVATGLLLYVSDRIRPMGPRTGARSQRSRVSGPPGGKL